MIGNKWWMKLFWGLMDMAITNAFIIKKMRMGLVGKTMQKSQFMRELAKDMVENTHGLDKTKVTTPVSAKTRGSAEKIKKRGVQEVRSPMTMDPDDHFEVLDERRRKGIRCSTCKMRQYTATNLPEGTKHQKGETIYYCQQCGVFLCKRGTKYQQSVKTNRPPWVVPGQQKRCWEEWHEKWCNHHATEVAKEMQLGKSYDPKLKKAL